MSALNPVGINSALPIASGANRRGVDQTAHQSRILLMSCSKRCRVVTLPIGTLPTASTTNFYVHAGEDDIISLGKVSAQRVVGVTTGTTTIIDFPEGTGQPFEVGDASHC